MKKTKKRLIIFLIALVSLLVTGCYDYGNNNKSPIAVGDFEFNKICLEGVYYYLGVHGYKGFMSVAFNQNGTPQTCK